jgi:hypothetical protein
MSKHFAIDMELFHLYPHLQSLDMGQFLEMHQPRALDMLLQNRLQIAAPPVSHLLDCLHSLASNV